MRLTIRVCGLTILDIHHTQDDDHTAGIDTHVTTQDSSPRFGFVPGHIEFDKPQPLGDHHD